ncbi:MAG TPA: nuclear transport factor 2 family protein [Acidimicrobiales bacterium]|nr:nuclear transport factor 2 family protein [Acidimicrobiales bacterium]
MDESTPLATVRQHVEAFNEGDLEGLLALFTKSATFVTGETTASSRDELSELFGPAMKDLSPHLEVLEMVGERDVVACQLRETLTFQGERLTFEIVAFFVVSNGLIAQGKVYREGSSEL